MKKKPEGENGVSAANNFLLSFPFAFISSSNNRIKKKSSHTLWTRF